MWVTQSVEAQLAQSCRRSDLIWSDPIANPGRRSHTFSFFFNYYYYSFQSSCVCVLCVCPSRCMCCSLRSGQETSLLPAEACSRPLCLLPSFFPSLACLSFSPLLHPVHHSFSSLFLSHSRPSCLIMSSSSISWRCGSKPREIIQLKPISHLQDCFSVFFCVNSFWSVTAHQPSPGRSAPGSVKSASFWMSVFLTCFTFLAVTCMMMNTF